jgi:signal transduction histidine kinase
VGLGLALAHDVAREHGGTLECRSVLGEGSVFTLRLPLSVAA